MAGNKKNNVAPINLGRKKQHDITSDYISGLDSAQFEKKQETEKSMEEVQSSDTKEVPEKKDDIKATDLKSKRPKETTTDVINKGVSFTMPNVLFLNKESIKKHVKPGDIICEILVNEEYKFSKGVSFSEEEIYNMIMGIHTKHNIPKKRINFTITEDMECFLYKFALETGVTSKTEIYNTFVDRAREGR